MNKEATIIAIDSPRHARRPLTEDERAERLLKALQPGTEREHTQELREVLESVTNELLRLERANPDSRSLHTATQHAECCLHALRQREAALDIDQLPF